MFNNNPVSGHLAQRQAERSIDPKVVNAIYAKARKERGENFVGKYCDSRYGVVIVVRAPEHDARLRVVATAWRI